jgi:hypothetical protein
MKDKKKSMKKLKKKKSSRASAQGRSKEAVAEVASMVDGLVEHKKFAAMAKYALNAVVKAVQTGVAGREQNVRALIGEGAIEAVRDIIKQHPGNESILELATEALYLLTIDDTNGAKYTTRVVECGALEVTLNSIKTNPDLKEGIVNSMALLTSCAERNASALATDAHVGAIVDVARAFADNPLCPEPCHAALEKICRREEGAAAFVEAQGIEVILASLTPERMTLPSLLPAVGCLDRLCRSGASMDRIKEAGGIDSLLAVLDYCGPPVDSSEGIALAGRVLNKIAGKFLPEFLAKLMLPDLAVHDRDHLLRIIANLAIEPRNADIIRSSGVLPTIVAFLSLYDEAVRTLRSAASSSPSRCSGKRPFRARALARSRTPPSPYARTHAHRMHAHTHTLPPPTGGGPTRALRDSAHLRSLRDDRRERRRSDFRRNNPRRGDGPAGLRRKRGVRRRRGQGAHLACDVGA